MFKGGAMGAFRFPPFGGFAVRTKASAVGSFAKITKEPQNVKNIDAMSLSLLTFQSCPDVSHLFEPKTVCAPTSAGPYAYRRLIAELPLHVKHVAP